MAPCGRAREHVDERAPEDGALALYTLDRPL